jgi:hypothetical protein
MSDGKTGTFLLKSEKSLFLGDASILSISLPKIDQKKKSQETVLISSTSSIDWCLIRENP